MPLLNLSNEIGKVSNSANNIAKATGNTVNMGSRLSTCAGIVGAASLATMAALEVYKMYASKDDHRLLAKISMEDCGGLSRMGTNDEGCYRDYVSKAIHRTIMSPNYVLFHNRFQECFANRPVQACGWGSDVFSAGG